MSVILHEVAHGYAALRLGDTTARDMGRLTLNPIPHIDPVGTVIIPLLLIFMQSPFLFGYAKPVPVNIMRLRDPKRGMVIVAAAGPLTNFALAFVSAVGLRLLFIALPVSEIIEPITFPDTLIVTTVLILFYLFIISIVLGLFNLIPVPPLDGGRIAVGLMPDDVARKYSMVEPFGIFIVLGLLFFTPLSQIFFKAINLLMGLLLGPEIATEIVRILAIT